MEQFPTNVNVEDIYFSDHVVSIVADKDAVDFHAFP